MEFPGDVWVDYWSWDTESGAIRAQAPSISSFVFFSGLAFVLVLVKSLLGRKKDGAEVRRVRLCQLKLPLERTFLDAPPSNLCLYLIGQGGSHGHT